MFNPNKLFYRNTISSINKKDENQVVKPPDPVKTDETKVIPKEEPVAKDGKPKKKKYIKINL